MPGASKVCAEPGCPSLTQTTRCDRHRKERRRTQDKHRPSASERGYDRKWARTRRAYLKRFPHCQATGCTEPAVDVHHLDGEGPKGPRGHDWTNLQGLCHSHHSRITMQRGGIRNNGHIIILAGKPGVGKSEVRRELAAILNIPSLGPDDFTDRWRGVLTELDRCPQAIVECNRLPRGLRDRAKKRGATIIHLILPDRTRKQRLYQKLPPSIANKRFYEQEHSLGYEDWIDPDLTLDTTGPPKQTATRIADALPGGGHPR